MTNHPAPIDLLWTLVCAALVMLMQGGFCLLETGCARAKNSINVAIKNLVDFCIASLLFWAVGFGLMFGASASGLIGTTHFLPGEGASPGLLGFFFFQLVFCGTSTTIISGAVAERIRFRGYLIIAALTSVLFYPVFGHWAWGGAFSPEGTGWLQRLGFIDFAGSTVVHSLGGWLSLAAVLVLGPRLGRFEAGRPMIHGHNLALSTVGCLILWFSWFGFNGGSTLAMNDVVPKILINTNLAAAAGGLAGLLMAWWRDKRADVSHAINGTLAGLVAITASCHLAEPAAAVCIGGCAGVLAWAATLLLDHWRIDDVVGAIPVHGVGGAFGTLAVALVVDPATMPMGLTRWEHLGVQALGVFTCFAWAFGVGSLVFRMIDRWCPLRVTAESEQAGLNLAEHGAHTELIDLLSSMEQHRQGGMFSRPVPVEPHTEVGQIATEYNRVLDVVNREIIERDIAAAALRAAEENFRSIFENSVAGIYQTTPEGGYLRANPALARIYGYDCPADLLRGITKIGSDLYFEPQRRGEFLTAIEERGMVTDFESQVRRRDGSFIWISENARVVRDSQGRISHFEGTVVEITERKQFADVQRQKEAAEAANQAKSVFLSSMSHELRTPLNGVLGMNELLRRTKLSSQQRQYVEACTSSGTMLLQLINDVLDLAKIESGELGLDLHECEIAPVVDEAISVFLYTARQKGLTLTSHLDPELSVPVLCDALRVRQILTNFIGNAIKFTASGTVSLDAKCIRRDQDRIVVRFVVSDTGEGIPQDKLGLLFSPFTQVDSTIARRFGGSGLGLSICKQLSQMMGGTIGVESTLGVGSTFWVELPLAVAAKANSTSSDQQLSAESRVPASDGPDQNRANGSECLKPSDNHIGQAPTRSDTITNEAGEQSKKRSAHVLVAEDNRINQMFVCELLKQSGCTFDIANNGDEALTSLNLIRYDLVLMDCQMPEMDGFTATREIRRREALGKLPGRLPVIALTANAIKGDRERCFDAGMDDYLSKPLQAARLQTTLAKYLATS